MKKGTVWTIVIIVVLVVLGIILLSVPKQKTPEAVGPETEQTGEAVVPETEEPGVPDVLEGAETVVPQGSLVTTGGEVVTPAGEIVDNEALPGSTQAPQQSRSLSEQEVPKGAVKLKVSELGFDPNEFTVRTGQVVTLSVSSGDRTHVFKFDDPGLQAVAVGIASEETRAITFKAPGKGDYSFYCDVPGHRGRGESGVMHVK